MGFALDIPIIPSTGSKMPVYFSIRKNLKSSTQLARSMQTVSVYSRPSRLADP